MKSCDELAGLYMPILEANGVKAENSYVRKVVEIIKERATFVNDFWDISKFLFIAPEEYDGKDVAKFYKSENYEPALEAMSATRTAEEMEEYIRSHEMPMGKVMNCIRLALTGASSGPGIADIMSCIGHDESLARMKRMKETLG